MFECLVNFGLFFAYRQRDVRSFKNFDKITLLIFFFSNLKEGGLRTRSWIDVRIEKLEVREKPTFFNRALNP